MRFGANRKTGRCFSSCILGFWGSNARTIFLEIERQKPSKWRKKTSGRLDACWSFTLKYVFFVVFKSKFSLEWFGWKLRFVKYIYRINNLLIDER